MEKSKKSSIETLRMVLWTAMIMSPILAMGILDSYTTLLPRDQEMFNFLVVCFIIVDLLGIFSIKKMEKYPMTKKIIIKKDNKKTIFIIIFTVLLMMIFLTIVSLLILLLIDYQFQTLNSIILLSVCTLFYGVFYKKLKKFLVIKGKK